MQLEFALLARFAQFAQDRTLSVMGACFDTLFMRALPRQLPPLYIVARFSEDEPTPTGSHLFSVDLELPDKTRRKLGPPQPLNDSIHADHVGNKVSTITSILVVALEVSVPGHHKLYLVVNGTDLAALPLTITISPEQ